MNSPRAILRRRFWRQSSRPQARFVPNLCSLLFHSALLLLLATSYRGNAGGGLGRGAAEFTTIITRDDGVVVANPWGDRPDAQVEGPPNDVPPGDQSQGSNASNQLLQTKHSVANEVPPAALMLPTADGPGASNSRVNFPTGTESAFPSRMRDPFRPGVHVGEP